MSSATPERALLALGHEIQVGARGKTYALCAGIQTGCFAEPPGGSQFNNVIATHYLAYVQPLRLDYYFSSLVNNS